MTDADGAKDMFGADNRYRDEDEVLLERFGVSLTRTDRTPECGRELRSRCVRSANFRLICIARCDGSARCIDDDYSAAGRVRIRDHRTQGGLVHDAIDEIVFESTSEEKCVSLQTGRQSVAFDLVKEERKRNILYKQHEQSESGEGVDESSSHGGSSNRNPTPRTA
ncbi:MAG: hypothetical protein LLG14_17255 [Nocardiaceae bacterium]|nr:hypothetical protein [Nocardiaceae bacterium]